VTLASYCARAAGVTVPSKYTGSRDCASPRAVDGGAHGRDRSPVPVAMAKWHASAQRLFPEFLMN
jgi:hypothetical protein